MIKKTFFEKILPAGFLLFLVVSDRLMPDFLPGLTSSELGLVENLQALLLLIAFFIALKLFFKSLKYQYDRWVKFFIFFGMMGCLYAFLEELSYGQHYLQWSTPEIWMTYNDQGETNLHNTSALLDQVPRLILHLGIMYIGIVIPIFSKYKPQYLPKRFMLVIPTEGMFFTALLILLLKFYREITYSLNLSFLSVFYKVGEVRELYFYYFVCLYFIFLNRNMCPVKKDISANIKSEVLS